MDPAPLTSSGADALRIIGPASEVATLWLEEVRRRRGEGSLAWADATTIANRVLEHLGATLHARPSGDLGDIGTLVGVGVVPDVDEILALRGVLHARTVGRMPLQSAMEILQVADRLIDELLSSVVHARLGALESAAFIDPLTGTGNRRALDRDLARELARSFRHSRPVCVVAIDVDGLKILNDTRGHAAGDDALRRLARALSDSLRVGDSVYRVGGDEFVVLLPETSATDVDALMERAAMAAPAFSYGVASAPEDATGAQGLLSCADAQLLEGRRLRRAEPAEAAAASDESPVLDLRDPVADALRTAGEPDGGRHGRPRLSLDEITVAVHEHELTAQVHLADEGRVLIGRASGSSAGAAANRIVAAAALDAVAVLDPVLGASFVDGVVVVRVAAADVAVVNLALIGDGELTAIGAAAVRERGVFDAVVRATMDALNRRLAMRRPTASASGTH